MNACWVDHFEVKKVHLKGIVVPAIQDDRFDDLLADSTWTHGKATFERCAALDFAYCLLIFLKPPDPT